MVTWDPSPSTHSVRPRHHQLQAGWVGGGGEEGVGGGGGEEGVDELPLLV